MRRVPYIDADDLARWHRNQAGLADALQAKINAGQTLGGQLLLNRYSLEVTTALVAWVEGDDDRFRTRLRSALAMFRAYVAWSTPGERSWLKVGLEDAVCIALVLRDPGARALLDDFPVDERATGGWMDDFVDALHALLAGEMQEAVVIARRMQARWPWKIVQLLAIAQLAVATGDAKALVDALAQATREFEREARGGDARGTPEAAVFLRGAALLKLHEFLHGVRLPPDGIDERLLPAI